MENKKKGLAKDVLEVVKADELFNADTILFQNKAAAKWKVHSSDNFMKSFKHLKSMRTKKNILNILLKLSTGWRPNKTSTSSVVASVCGSILNKFKVENLYIVCSVDIIKDINYYTQVLKAWDVLPLEDIPQLEKRLEAIFEKYTHDYMNRCKEKCLDGDLELPKTWSTITKILRFRDVSSNEMGDDIGVRSYVENSRVSESLSLMKFYTLSSGMVSHLLSDCELELPFEVTDQERDLIDFPRSTFILGRSGTGKTTVLTRKLFKKEELHHRDQISDAIGGKKEYILRQIFVTVSPQLCYAIKRHIFDLKRFNIRKNIGASRSVAFQSFLRTKEVTYERFSAVYWPHFNTQITKLIDSSTIFTEIMSQIKGGLQSIEASNGKMSREHYLQLSDNRVSCLSRQKREMVFEIYQDYVRMKMKNGEFDLADLVNDLHARLKVQKCKGDLMDYVYIDEVQDLTMSQIALFKYICKNADEGFVFSGDTAQTIARGINFRFQDIRSLFYTKFMMECTQEHNVRKEKGHLSPIFNLTQNFRTHTEILNLSQSIIELLYHFFPNSIDVLKPEKSLICGEPPILLESGNDESVIITIFGDNGNGGDKIVGFGAEQVILVRDDSDKLEVFKHVGKNALVLTILECKGLEFQDVLLYNFFGSSPLKNKWRVMYAYMKELGLLDSTMQMKEQGFNEAKHNIMCSELKQLYVAITRTRQRLWICENNNEISKPMFDYWITKSLVQVRQLNDSLVQAMKVESSPEEWRTRGIKLFSENNYEMAILCFERAGDSYWERIARAACLQANAELVRFTNPENANAILREAAEIYDSIGKSDSAAQCFFELGDYKRAGKIYMERCGELEKAGECFCRSGSYELAAEAYSRGNIYAECLAVCSERKLFELGLHYIEVWKRSDCSIRSGNIDEIRHKFLESCARHYHKLQDNKSMMKFVTAFQSMELKRDFLNSLDCIDNPLLEADLLEKAGHIKEACMLILNYVLSNSLWSNGSKGWPLKEFPQKPEILSKAISLAKNESSQFYELVCVEADILSNKHNNFMIMYQQWIASKQCHNIKGEILCARKILDEHLCSSSKYVWVDDMILDMKKHLEETIYEDVVSIESLVYFWNYYEDKIVNILEFLGNLETKDAVDKELRIFGDFCFNFLGVMKKYKENGDTIYLLLNSDSDWIADLDHKYSLETGIGMHHFVPRARKYWCSEIFSIGMKLLNHVEELYKVSINKSLSSFCQSKTLSFLYEVSMHLFVANFMKLQSSDRKELEKIIESSTSRFFSTIFLYDWKTSLQENIVYLRGTEISKRMLKDFIVRSINLKIQPSFGEVGRVLLSILGSGEVDNELSEKVSKRFYGFSSLRTLLLSLSTSTSRIDEVQLVCEFYAFLVQTYNVNLSVPEQMFAPEPHLTLGLDCFLYLMERFLILVSYCQGYYFATKSSFVEWLIFQNDYCTTLRCDPLVARESMKHILAFIEHVLSELINNQKNTVEWMWKTGANVREQYRFVVLRLVVMLCLVRLNFGGCGNLISHVLDKKYIVEQLPRGFCNILKGGNKNVNVNVVAEAFGMIGNPLVIVNLGRYFPKYVHPYAIFIDMTVTQKKNDILKLLFAKNNGVSDVVEIHQVYEEAHHPTGCDGYGNFSEINLSQIPKDPSVAMMNGCFWKFFEVLKSAACNATNVSELKVSKGDVDMGMNIIMNALTACAFRNEIEYFMMSYDLNGMWNDLKKIEDVMTGKEPISSVVEICNRCLSRRPTVEPYLQKMLVGSTPTSSSQDGKFDSKKIWEAMGLSDEAYDCMTEAIIAASKSRKERSISKKSKSKVNPNRER
ncbi:hypothetical protein ACFE04_028325 [Oxalis oulophora]